MGGNKMQKWIVTGISGSERIELLNELKNYIKNNSSKRVEVYDVGELIKVECKKNGKPLKDERILDVDRSLLNCLRSCAIREIQIQMSLVKNNNIEAHFIGIHATFRWKNRIIPGILYKDLCSLKPTGLINIHRDVKDICAANKKNTKWDEDTLPDLKETQEWMMEEEFVTEVLADVLEVPIYLISRKHNLSNLADLFLSNKKKIYLSYPIYF
jgi:adenylate kinase